MICNLFSDGQLFRGKKQQQLKVAARVKVKIPEMEFHMMQYSLLCKSSLHTWYVIYSLKVGCSEKKEKQQLKVAARVKVKIPEMEFHMMQYSLLCKSLNYYTWYVIYSLKVSCSEDKTIKKKTKGYS